MVLSDFTLGSILLGAALVLVVGLALLRPLLISPPANNEAEEIEALQVQRYRLLKQLRLLDEDMEAGKIAPELYQYERPQLVEQTALVWQQLETLETAAAQAAIPDEMDDRIEAAITAYRSQPQSQPAGSKQFCPNCGRSIDESDSFCASCGQPLITDNIMQAAPTA